jgi:Flp pilus assembly protein TadD
MVLPKEVFAKALAAAKKAVELDPKMAEARAILGWIRMAFNWDWPGAESELKQAIQLNPSYPVAHANYATYLTCNKKFGDAIAEVQRASALDPLSASVSATFGNIYYLSRQTDRAVFHLTNLLKTETRMPVAYFYRGTAQIQQGRLNEAIRDFQTYLAISPDDSGAIADLGLAYGRAGNAGKAKEQIGKLEQLRKQRYVAPYFLALPYIGLGETDRPVDLLEQAAEDRAFPLIYLGVEPKLDPLRTNPRFQRLAKLVGLG